MVKRVWAVCHDHWGHRVTGWHCHRVCLWAGKPYNLLPLLLSKKSPRFPCGWFLQPFLPSHYRGRLVAFFFWCKVAANHFVDAPRDVFSASCLAGMGMGMGPTFAKVELVPDGRSEVWGSLLQCPWWPWFGATARVLHCAHFVGKKKHQCFLWRWVVKCTSDGFDWIGLIGWDADWHMPHSGFQSLFLAATPGFLHGN